MWKKENLKAKKCRFAVNLLRSLALVAREHLGKVMGRDWEGREGEMFSNTL